MGNHITSCLVCTRVFSLYFLSIALPRIHSLHFVYTGTKSVYVYQCLSKISRITKTDVQQAGQTFLGAVFVVCIIKFLLQHTDFYQFPLAFSCLLQAEVHTNHLPWSDISNQVPFSSCFQKGSKQNHWKPWSWKSLIGECSSGSANAFLGGDALSREMETSLPHCYQYCNHVCVCKKSRLSFLSVFTELLQNDSQACIQKTQENVSVPGQACHEKPVLQWLLCKIFFWARERVQPKGWEYFLTRQRVEISAKSLNLPWKHHAPGFQKQKQDRDKKAQLHPSYE